MKKYIIASICASVSALVACSNNDVSQSNQQETQKPLNKVMQAIEMATSHSDYRLYMTQGRNLTIPGFENAHFEEIKSVCGLKSMKGTGDVFKSDEAKQQRRLKYQFAKQFNEIMYPLCLKNQKVN